MSSSLTNEFGAETIKIFVHKQPERDIEIYDRISIYAGIQN